MAREPQAITLPDLTLFARNLRSEIITLSTPPGHQEMLNLVARAAGYRNHQHLRAAGRPKPAKVAGSRALQAALRDFDAAGLLHRWPKGHKRQGLCLWVFWDALPDTELSEREVNAIMDRGATFADAALLRRSLVDHGMVSRTIDGRTYRRQPHDVPGDGAALIREIRQRRDV